MLMTELSFFTEIQKKLIAPQVISESLKITIYIFLIREHEKALSIFSQIQAYYVTLLKRTLKIP